MFVLNVVYQLPFGKGKMFGSNASTAENLIIGGWQITGTTNYSAGLPFTPSYGECGSDKRRWCLLSEQGQPCTLVHGWRILQQHHSHGDVLHASDLWVMPWVEPTVGTLGNAGSLSLNGPRSFTTDISIMKNFGLTERFNLQFRMDMFNLFNHPVLGFNSNQGNTCIDCVNSSGQVFNKPASSPAWTPTS